MSRKVQITKSERGINLLDWLTNRFTYHSRTEWTSNIVHHRVKVNSQITHLDYVLNQNDVISYEPENLVEPEVNTNYSIVHNSRDILIIDKPYNLPCHPGGIYYKNTLWYLLKDTYPNVHMLSRLDRETSGLMIVVINDSNGKYYYNLGINKGITKKYKVLVHGTFPEYLDASGFLIKDEKSSIRKKRKFISDADSLSTQGQKVRTEFKTIQQNKDFSLLEATLHTGRMHQIRSTLFSLGYPVVGDKVYGLDEQYFIKLMNDELTDKDKTDLILPGQALHSAYLSFSTHDGTRIELVSPVPQKWNSLFNK
ncbi:RluA family pseudouridine synthase [Spirochaeta cellobiosiphila]|uniref:RluA family pseudouridine synthase n=1 Tax=Spirochaeta cellobiosiphila TaxID=504483 RepID=UPI0003F870C3|nr:RluA family pseudouridine synthase [Spirochaeta cellobiosiphila]